MKLKTIKEKSCDKNYTKYAFKTSNLIKSECKILQSATMFFLGYFYFGQIFLCNGKIYISNTEFEYDKNREPIADTMTLTELNEIVLLKDYPKIENDIKIKTIIATNNSSLTDIVDNFLNWIDEPCDLNEEIDNPYWEVIKFLNDYTQETFKTERYKFYSKKDDDYNFINNIYAYDLKNNIEMKLYTPLESEKIDGEWKWITPKKALDVAVDDLGKNISNYQKLQCKKIFLKLANEINSYFKVKNYWVMELVKLAIQPVLVLYEWSCHRCFCKPKLFGHIWVYDFPSVDEEPSFFITDKHFTKVAVLKFKKPEYLFKGIYKRNLAKAKGWELNEKEIKELIEFLQSPSNRGADYGSGAFYNGYRKYVKTNWQQLIFEYNHNTAYWDCDDNGEFNDPIIGKIEDEIEQLPFDLPMPNYMKLLNDKW